MHCVELALSAGRMLQSSQTGFVHFCYEAKELPHQTIPVLENALFALALFRTRLSENVLEGKEIVERLLFFEKNGNFPVYLHEYPVQKDPYLGMRLMPVFYWLLHDFSHVIGSLKEKLITLLERIVESLQGKDLPRWACFRLEAYQGRIGERPVGHLEWGEALISLQIAESKGPFLDEMLKEAAKFWHPTLQLYVGPSLRRHQEGSSPEFTLFDFFMCQWQKSFPERAEAPRPLHLWGSLIRPLQKSIDFEKKPFPFLYFNQEEEFPFFIAWGSHTLIMAKKNLQVTGNTEEFAIIYPEDLPDTEDKSFELNFFLNAHPDHTLFVNGKKASCFRLKDKVEICSREAMITFSFFAEEGTYFGHFMRGNRPSQLGLRGEQSFSAYDWRIAIRTIVRKPRAKLRVKVQLQSKENPQLHPLHAFHYPHIG